MTLTIDLSEDLENRLRTAARANGTDEVETARQVLESGLPAAQDLTPAQRAERFRRHFEESKAEAEAMTPGQIAEEDAKWAEIERDLNEGLSFHDVDVTGCE